MWQPRVRVTQDLAPNINIQAKSLKKAKGAASLDQESVENRGLFSQMPVHTPLPVNWEASNNLMRSLETLPIASSSETLQNTIQCASKGRKARRAAERRATKGHHNQLRQQKLKEAEAYKSYTSTLAEWGSWAWEKVTEIGQGALKKVFGVDVVEIASVLKGVANSSASVKNKLLYLALYGSYQATEYLKNNLDTIIGGEVSAMMAMQNDINEQLEKASALWEKGGITEDDVEDEIKSQIIDYLVGEG